MSFQRINCGNYTPQPIFDFSMTKIGSKLYVFGGQNQDGFQNILNIYSLRKNQWTKPVTYNNEQKPCKRSNHQAFFQKPSGLIIYAGMNDHEVLNDMFYIDIKTFLWQQIPNQIGGPQPSYGQTICKISKLYLQLFIIYEILKEKTIYFFAGVGGSKELNKILPQNQIWKFSLTNNSFVQYNVKNTELCPQGLGWQAIQIDEGNILLIGQKIMQLRMLEINSFTITEIEAKGQAPSDINFPSIVKSEGSDHILLFGGSFEDNSLNSVYALEFDEDANFKWSLIHIGGERPNQRNNHRAVIFEDLQIIFGGQFGLTGTNCINDMWILNWKNTMKSERQPHEDEPIFYRVQHGMCHVEDQKYIMIFGGNCQGFSLNDCHAYFYETQDWQQLKIKNAKNMAMMSMNYLSSNQCVYLYGGGSLHSNKVEKELYVIDPKKLTFNPVITLGQPFPRYGVCSWFIKDKLYVFGGFISKQGYTNQLYLIRPKEISPTWELLDFKSPTNQFPLERAFASVCVVNDYAYIYGGSKHKIALEDLWICDIKNSLWKSVSLNQINESYGHTATILEMTPGRYDNMQMLILGGTKESISSVNNNIQEIFLINYEQKNSYGDDKKENLDLQFNQLSLIGEPLGERCFHQTVKIQDMLYVYGGNKDTSMMEIKLPSSQKRKPLTDFSEYIPLDYFEYIDKNLYEDEEQEQKKKKMISSMSKAMSNLSGSHQSIKNHQMFAHADDENDIDEQYLGPDIQMDFGDDSDENIKSSKKQSGKNRKNHDNDEDDDDDDDDEDDDDDDDDKKKKIKKKNQDDDDDDQNNDLEQSKLRGSKMDQSSKSNVSHKSHLSNKTSKSAQSVKSGGTQKSKGSQKSK